MLFIGIDDTDVLNSRGTGHLGRMIAESLTTDFPIAGVTRHQLLVDPRIPYTAKNSCAAIHVAAQESDISTIAHRVEKILMDNFEHGSDPGLAVATNVPKEIMEFGRQAKKQVLTKDKAQTLAQKHHIFLKGLGGTNDGIIGALSAVGLAASGNDGRYIQVGRTREMEGLATIDALIAAGISEVQTLAGEPVTTGMVNTEKMRPSRRDAKVILYVEKAGENWNPLKID